MKSRPFATSSKCIDNFGLFRRIFLTCVAVVSVGMALPANGWAQVFTDLTPQVSFTKSGLVLNRTTNTFNTVVSIKNVSNNTITGSLALIVSGISPSTVTLANSSGQTPAAKPYVSINTPANGLAPGAVISNIVLAFNDPTRVTFTISLSLASVVGLLLPGNPSAPALPALFDKPPVPVQEADIDSHVILTRIDLRLRDGATIGELNAALTQVGGGIISMTSGFPALTIAVPRQPSFEALQGLVDTLNLMPGIELATVGREAGPMDFPFIPSTDSNRLAQAAHLLPERFPAAWNASALLKGCSKLPVLVADSFGSVPTDFASQIPTFTMPAAPAGPLSDYDANHGFEVARLIGAAFSTSPVPGTNPFTQCLDFRLVQVAGLTQRETQFAAIAQNFPAGRFIMNYSMGYNDDCYRPGNAAPLDCIPPFDSTLAPPLERAKDALEWKEATAGRWSDFLAATSAGNSRNAFSTDIYPGMGDSRYTNMLAVSALNDPTFQWVLDASLWVPSPDFPDFASLVPADPIDLAELQANVAANDVADNVLVVGSTTALPLGTLLTATPAPGALEESEFSESNPNVKAVGERMFNTDDQGTSYAAPQVAGLASYLWLLSPQLRALPPSVTAQAIVANAQTGNSASGLIDAYSTVLSLDQPGSPGSQLTPAQAPIRLAILDVDGSRAFDENDINLFLQHYFFVDSNNQPTSVESNPTNVDFGRYDLNGDGFTGGPGIAAFDLDRAQSKQFGATVYSSDVQQNIEGQTWHFNSNSLTDLQILCYYAYSPLYTGSPDARKSLLDGRCGLAVNPKTVTLNAGQTQQFTASPAIVTVTWSASCGSIDPNTGLYTAGASAGPCTVTATNTVNTDVSATATVTVSAPAPSNIQLVSRSSGMFAQVGVDPSCTPDGDHDQKNSTAFGYYADAAGAGLTCTSPSFYSYYQGTITDVESASASQVSNVTQDPSTGVLTVTGNTTASTSAGITCNPSSPNCPLDGLNLTGSSSSISVAFDVVGTTAQPYNVPNLALGDRCQAYLQNRVTFATTFLSNGQMGTLPPAKYTFGAGCSAPSPEVGSPYNNSASFTFVVGR